MHVRQNERLANAVTSGSSLPVADDCRVICFDPAQFS